MSKVKLQSNPPPRKLKRWERANNKLVGWSSGFFYRIGDLLEILGERFNRVGYKIARRRIYDGDGSRRIVADMPMRNDHIFDPDFFIVPDEDGNIPPGDIMMRFGFSPNRKKPKL